MAEDQNRTLQEKFMLRLPDGMRERLKASAAENKRSTNAEIIARLEASFEPDDLSFNDLLDQLREWRQFAMHTVKELADIRAGKPISSIKDEPQADE